MLLRLRQLTAHVLMLQFVIKDLLDREDIERIRQVVNDSDYNDDTGHTILAIRRQLEALEKEEMKNQKGDSAKQKSLALQSGPSRDPQALDADADDDDDNEADDADTVPDDLPGPSDGLDGKASGNTFGKEFDFKPYFRALTTGDSWEKAKEKAVCCNCEGQAGDFWLSSCNHIYCDDCYQSESQQSVANEEHGVVCKKCGQRDRKTSCRERVSRLV